MNSTSLNLESQVARARRLEYLSIGWNALEAGVALASGAMSGSVALVGFGLDSVLETVSAAVVLWRFRTEGDGDSRERDEVRAQRLVGGCFLLLALYVTIESARALWSRARPEQSISGIAIAIAAVIVMPLIGRAKRRVAAQLGSGALQSDSYQADFCAWLSAILLLGLILNAWLGWWWADAAAALVMVPIITREGLEGLRGKKCACG